MRLPLPGIASFLLLASLVFAAPAHATTAATALATIGGVDCSRGGAVVPAYFSSERTGATVTPQPSHEVVRNNPREVPPDM